MTAVETPPTEAPEPTPRPAPQRRPGLNTDTIALGALFVAVFAFLAAIFAVALAARAAEDDGGGGGAAAPAGAVEVDLMEFMIMPEEVSVPAGTANLHVVNTGSVEHNLAVDGGNETPMLAAGEEADLDIGGLEPGTYDLICTVAGHVESGMTGTLTVT